MICSSHNHDHERTDYYTKLPETWPQSSTARKQCVRCGTQQQPECKYQTSMYAYVDKLRSVQAAICGNDGNGSMLDSIMALQTDVCMIMYVDAIEAVTICDQHTG